MNICLDVGDPCTGGVQLYDVYLGLRGKEGQQRKNGHIRSGQRRIGERGNIKDSKGGISNYQAKTDYSKGDQALEGYPKKDYKNMEDLMYSQDVI